MEIHRLKEILDKFSHSKVLVIGDSILDEYIVGKTDRISPEAPVPILLKQELTYRAGGAANVAMNLACLGASVTLITSIGLDEKGQKLRKLLSENKIQLLTPNASHTICKTRVVAGHQQIVRIDEEKKKTEYAIDLTLENIEEIMYAIEDHDAVIMSDYNKGVLTQDLVDIVVEMAKEREKFIALDPKPTNKINFQGLDLITPNEKEANELVGAHDEELLSLHRRLSQKYQSKFLAITLGEKGLMLSSGKNEPIILPSLAKGVCDVSGSGDSALSILSLTLLHKLPINEAAYLANLVCAIVISKLGTATTNAAEILSWNRQ